MFLKFRRNTVYLYRSPVIHHRSQNEGIVDIGIKRLSEVVVDPMHYLLFCDLAPIHGSDAPARPAYVFLFHVVRYSTRILQ